MPVFFQGAYLNWEVDLPANTTDPSATMDRLPEYLTVISQPMKQHLRFFTLRIHTNLGDGGLPGPFRREGFEEPEDGVLTF
jgi:hypothetical protein